MEAAHKVNGANMIIKSGVPGPFGTYDLVNLSFVGQISICSKASYAHYKHLIGDHILMAWSSDLESGTSLYIGNLEDCTMEQDRLESSLTDQLRLHVCRQSVALDGTT
jgi:hypothetical protein